MPGSESPPPYALGNPLAKLRRDVGAQRRASRQGPLPPGPAGVSPARDFQFMRDPLSVLLPAYEEHCPIFTIRFFHGLGVVMLGPEAQHFLLVSNAGKFHWREGMYRELIPLLGDGLITTDDEYHDRSRRLMLPVFHTERLALASRIMVEEIDRAVSRWSPGEYVEVYGWARQLGRRIAMRALFGFDADAAQRRRNRARVRAGNVVLRQGPGALSAARSQHPVREAPPCTQAARRSRTRRDRPPAADRGEG